MEQASDLRTQTPETLRDATERIRRQLLELLEKPSPFTTIPRGLYILSPGIKKSWEEIVDNGCRGGWTEYHIGKLDDASYAVTALEKPFPRSQSMTATIKLDDHGSGSIRLDAETISKCHFLEDETVPTEASPDSCDLVELLASTVDDSPYSVIRNLPEVFDGKYDIVATSRFPLEHPLSVGNRDEKLLPLNHSAASAAVRSTAEGVLVDLEVYRYGSNIHTGWLPLDKIHFELRPGRETDRLNSKLFIAASRLLAYYETSPFSLNLPEPNEIEAMNQTIEQIEVPVHYFLPRASRRQSELTDQFITASINESSELTDVRSLTGSRWSSDNPYIMADKVVHSPTTAWVVDEARSLAVPMSDTAFNVRANPSYSSHLVDYLKNGD